MEGTLGLRALSTPLKGRGSTVLSQVRRAPGQPGRRSCLHKGSSAAVLCVYTLQLNWFPAVCLQSCTCVHFIALLVSQLGSSQGKYTCICLGLDRMSSSINLLLFKQLSGTFQNILQKNSGLEDSRTFLMQSLYNCTLPGANLTSILYTEPL